MSLNPLQPREAVKLRVIVSLAVAALIGTVASVSSYSSKAGSTSAAGEPSASPSGEPAPSLTPEESASTPTPAAPTPAATKTPTRTPALARTVYRNGSYTATGSYTTSEGTEQIRVTLTISGDVVTDTSAQNLAQSPESASYESRFINNYRAYVVGKPIATLALGKIAGASLTPNGFNSAVAQIRAQAR